MEEGRWPFLPILTLFASAHAVMALAEWREAGSAPSFSGRENPIVRSGRRPVREGHLRWRSVVQRARPSLDRWGRSTRSSSTSCSSGPCP